MRFVVRHWRGEYSLARSFWINGIVLFVPALIVQLAVVIAARRLGFGHGVPYVATLATVAALGYLFVLWQLVGIWRSAGRSRAAGRRFWPLAVRVLVVAIVAFNAVVFVAKSLPDMQRVATERP
ncbi:MAG: hypothetical protein WDN03_01530 [Rhizomicrobium sp.]